MKKAKNLWVPTNIQRNEAGLAPAAEAAYDASVSLKEPIATTDAFSNAPFRLGFGTQNPLEATTYPLRRLSQNYNLLTSLFRGNWVVKNIVSTIPEDMTKKWFRLSTARSPEDIEVFMRKQRSIPIRKQVVRGFEWGRLYGGAVGLIVIEGQNDLTKPLDYDRIMPDSFRGLYIVDRWSGVYPSLELVTDIGDPEFGLPMYYEIRDANGVEYSRIHHSRCIRFIGRELPWAEQTAETYWGQSEIEAIYEEIVKKDNVSHNIASLTFKASLDVIEVAGLDQLQALSSAQTQQKFWSAVQAQTVMQSNLGVRLINKGDTFNQYQYGFNGLREIYEAILLDVSGASRIPATKLFGRSPQGMNSTGESDLRNYEEYIEQLRTSMFEPIVNKLLPIMALSFWGEIPDDLDPIYDPIRTNTEEEKAVIAQKRVTTLTTAFTADGIDKATFQRELKGLAPATGMFNSIPDSQIDSSEELFFSEIQSMNDPMAGLDVPPTGSDE